MRAAKAGAAKVGTARAGTALVLLAALLGACSEQPSYSKDGGSEEQFVKDEQLCRAQVRRRLATEQGIDDSRRDIHRTESARAGQTTLPDIMANTSDNRRSGKLMESCMSARGWSPKSQWWQRSISW